MKRVAFSLAAGAAIGVSTLIASPIPDATPISDDGASSLASVLAMPVSRASVAMLVEYPIEPSALTRLGEALRDPRPDVRAVAARVAFANRASVHVGVLSRALQAEQDPAAAIEELRALALFGNITTDQIALDVSRKMGASARLDFLIAFARSRPADFGSHIDALFTPEADTVTLLAPLAATLPESAPWLTPLFERAAGKLTWWNELLDGLDTQHARFAEAIGLGLRSQDERIRAATLWHVADVLASGRTLPDDLA